MRGLLLLLVAAVLLPLLAVQTGVYYSWYKTRAAEELDANLVVARATAMTFMDFVQDVQRQEAALGAALLEPSVHPPEEADRLLDASVKEYASVVAFNWVNPQGKVIASSDPKAIGLDLSDRKHIREVQAGADRAVSDMLVDRATGQPRFFIVRSVRDAEGKLRAIFTASVDPEKLGNSLAQLHRPEGAEITLFDRQGILVCVNPVHEQPLRHRSWLDEDALLRQARQDGEAKGSFVSAADRVRRLGARVQVDDAGWLAGASTPEELAMAPLAHSVWNALSLLLAVAAVCVGLAVLLGRKMLHPLQQLGDHARAIGDGQLEHRVEPTRITELAQLGGAFNQMTANLRHAREILEEANATLERRVEERTAELHAASLYARGLLEASLDPLVTISPEGKITDVNEATEQVTGLPRQRLVGSDFCDYFTEPDRAREGYRKVIAEGLVRDYPLTIRHASGKPTDVLYNATVYRNRLGEIQGVFADARDITERKKAEEELARYRERLEELVEERTAALEGTAADLARSNRDLEQFAYVASHDLQEPLRMVSGYLQLLKQRYQSRLDGDADEFIAFAVDGASRMQTLINDLLTYSRVGTRDRAHRPTDSGQMLARAIERLKTDIAESGAAIEHGSLPTVRGDEAQLVLLFENLIGNAVKFRGDRPPEIRVNARRDGESWLFSVQDNGIGIDPEYHQRVFVIFQRLHLREKYPGTGIGLALCKRIVERHGGRIWVESEPGKGSTFYFTLRDAGEST